MIEGGPSEYSRTAGSLPKLDQNSHEAVMIDFLLDAKFLIPFLSTAGASLTIIILQSIHRIDLDRKKKIYTVTYMAVVAVRLLQSCLIIKKHTIIPHIAATEKILNGDKELLRTTLLADEFDILTDGSMDLNDIPEEHKILLGYDDINLLQAFQTFSHIYKIDDTRKSLNNFVKNNLKSELTFTTKGNEEQQDILNTYWDYLCRLDHEEDRLIAFAMYILLPRIHEYIDRITFLLYSKNNIKEQFASAEALADKYADIIPKPDFFETMIDGGIQRVVNGDI